MRVVDIFADLYEWDDKERARAHRVARAAETIYKVARHGASAAGPLAVVDAALAVLDAVDAYTVYRRAREVTRQLEIEGDKLRQLLEVLYEQQTIKAKVMDEKHAQQASSLRARLERRAAEIEITGEAFDSLSRQVKKLGPAIAEMRLNSAPNCRHLLQLEHAYYDLVDLQLQTMMDSVKE